MTSYAGYGDLLYLTPLFRFLKRLGCDLDVWAANHEPYLNNPDITDLYTFEKDHIVYPLDFYRKIFNFCEWGPVFISNIHSIDAFTMKALNIVLRDKEKDLVFGWSKDDELYVRKLLKQHGLIPTKAPDGPCNYVIVSPVITWPSRTFPLEFYKELILKIQNNGDKVILMGKDLHIKGHKSIYPAEEFPGAINLMNRLSFAEAGCLYSMSKISIANESANMVLSCTNNTCWNIYLPTLTPPEFRLPWRQGDKNHRNYVVANDDDFFPSTNYRELALYDDLRDPEVQYPGVEKVFDAYQRINNATDTQIH
jgi:hypothetical protein